MRWLLCCLALWACGGDAAAPPDARPDAPPPIDAALAACGIVVPGSRCASATTIERCDGESIVADSCDAGLCGLDPAGGGGFTCVSLPSACGAVGSPGNCSGPILSRCRSARLQIVDCEAAFTECRLNSAGVAECTTDCEQAALDAQGKCVGSAILRCGFHDGHYAVETVTCPAGTTCAPSVPGTGYAGCVPVQPCEDVGANGLCEGDVLRRCAGGSTKVTDCAAAGKVCVWGGDSAGYVCAPGGAAGARRMSGVVRYEDRKPTLFETGAFMPRPVRGAAVAVIDDASGGTLGVAGTADDGSYQIRYDAAPDTPVHIVAIAVGATRSRPVRVIRPDGLLHGFAGPSFAAADDGSADLLCTERSGSGGAFAIFDDLVAGVDTVRSAFELDEPVPLVAVWAKGHSFFTGERSGTMWVNGTFDDEDSFDDPVLLHELGHYVEEAYGRTSNPIGPHRLYTPTDPRLAWSEGWASYWSAVVRNDPTYQDSNIFGGFQFDLERDKTLADPDKNQRQEIAENTVGEILWDLGDDGASDDDPVPGPQADVIHVQNRYFPTAVNRGFLGIDLVDFLDGYLALGGAGKCAATRAVVASRKFPYDFGGPVPCPLP